MYDNPTKINITIPNMITEVPCLVGDRFPKCIVIIAKAALIILLPIALGIPGLHSRTAVNKRIIDKSPSIPQIPP